jgi:hypothetical protein
MRLAEEARAMRLRPATPTLGAADLRATALRAPGLRAPILRATADLDTDFLERVARVAILESSIFVPARCENGWSVEQGVCQGDLELIVSLCALL